MDEQPKPPTRAERIRNGSLKRVEVLSSIFYDEQMHHVVDRVPDGSVFFITRMPSEEVVLRVESAGDDQSTWPTTPDPTPQQVTRTAAVLTAAADLQRTLGLVGVDVAAALGKANDVARDEFESASKKLKALVEGGMAAVQSERRKRESASREENRNAGI